MSKNNQDNFPCIDCIIFPLCKADYNRERDTQNLPDKTLMVPFFNTLYDKCSLIRAYYKTAEYPNTRISLRRTFVEEYNENK